MNQINKLIFLLFSTSCVFASSYFPHENKSLFSVNKSIDLIFAHGFERAAISPQLFSEVPFSDELPELESGHESVGSSAFSFSVDPSGQSSAQYPIFVGTGTAGVAPSVSLRYSSAAGDGHVGVGWSISGITVITRCRETEESKDDSGSVTPKPITFGEEDKFCLNGERLFAVSGLYGSDGTEYRTEKEQFARIISYDSSTGDNNPDYFTIERKDGSISHYGNTTDSVATIESDDPNITGKINSWSINRYQDTLGNYIEYSYTQHDYGEFTLTDINYTGNDQTNPVLLPYNNIHFTYEDRDDELHAYLGGVLFKVTKRLASIQSKIDEAEVRDYTLLYDTSSTTSRNLLTSIKECRDEVCLPLTSFDWSTPNRQFNSNTASTGSFPTGIKSSKLGDTNGDARADLVFVDEDSNAFKIAYSNGHTGFGLSINTDISAPTGDEIDNKWHLLDYNADGKQDLMKQAGGFWVVHMALSEGFNSMAESTHISTAANSDFKVIDMNGDGLSDLLYPHAGLSVRYLERSGSGYQFSQNIIRLSLPNHPNDIDGLTAPANYTGTRYSFYQDDDINFYTPDINGDGVADLILRTNIMHMIFPQPIDDEDQPYQFISAGSDIDTEGEPEIEIYSSSWVGFVNNGLNHIGEFDYKTENYLIGSAALNHFDEPIDENYKFIDINDDGLIDVVDKVTTNNWQFRLGTGQGFTETTPIATISNEEHLQFIDHDLDGYLDLIYPSNGNNNPYIFRKWNGNTFNSSNLFTGAEAKNLNNRINLFLDFDGDGAVDHLHIEQNGNQKLYARNDAYTPADKIITFINGLGTQTKVLYRPLTFSTAYGQGNHQGQWFTCF